MSECCIYIIKLIIGIYLNAVYMILIKWEKMYI